MESREKSIDRRLAPSVSEEALRTPSPSQESVGYPALVWQAARRGTAVAIVAPVAVVTAIYGADAAGILASAFLPDALASLAGQIADLLFALAALLITCLGLSRMTSAAVPLPGRFTDSERARHRQYLRDRQSGVTEELATSPLPAKRKWANAIHETAPLWSVLLPLISTTQFIATSGGMAWWHLALFATLSPLTAVTLGRAAMRTPGRPYLSSLKARCSGAVPIAMAASFIFILSTLASSVWGPLAFLALLVCPLIAAMSRAGAEESLRRLPSRASDVAGSSYPS